MSDATYSCGNERASELLATALASLDTDRDAAKACIQQAAELLGCRCISDSKHAQRPLPARGGLAHWQKQRLTQYVAKNLGECIRAIDLARLTGLSTGHFFRAFRESFGEPPLVYVTRQRVRRCQELILVSREPLSRIALECGMSDQAHLTRVFHRIVGMNPSVWRRQFAPHVHQGERRANT
jgi:AraC family transcriptional regulator